MLKIPINNRVPHLTQMPRPLPDSDSGSEPRWCGREPKKEEKGCQSVSQKVSHMLTATHMLS